MSGPGNPRPLLEARIAIVHEWLGPYAGSEQVVAEMLEVFPQADLFATVHNPEEMYGTPLEGVKVQTTFLQSFPAARKKYRAYLPLMPLAVEQLDLRSYDIVISSSHAVAKGVLTRAGQLHVSYTHTPMRYAWDLYLDYLQGSGAGWVLKDLLVRPVMHYMRLWDSCAANRVDAFLVNSGYVARRIGKIYRRPARVLYPPVDVERFRADAPREDFFLAVSRFAPYKRMGLIVEAFTRSGKPLVVIGDGSEFEKVRRMAGKNVTMMGRQPDEMVADCLQRARAFVFAAEEDFGIVPVEAQAAGCPVIAYGKGGALETVVSHPSAGATGMFFDERSPEGIMEAVESFEHVEHEFGPENCRRNASRFDRRRFHREFEDVLRELWEKFQNHEALE